jgi:FkbM family methyltransferase
VGLRNLLHRAKAALAYRDGLALVPSDMNHEWAQHQFLRRFLARLDVDCVLDVGANVGQYGATLRTIGYGGLILSFEPDPNCYAQLLRASAGDAKWHAYDVALGREPGEGELNLMAAPVFNSFRRPTTADTASFEGDNKVVEQITVPVQTLNALLPELAARFGFERPYLKMDTQGFDLEIFRGADEVRDRLAGIQSEVAVQRIYENIPDWRASIAEYEAGGFALAALYAVNPHLPQLVEFDCFLSRAS